MARLPQPGGDAGNWGHVLNEFLLESLDTDGSLKNSSIAEVKLATTLQNKINSKANSSNLSVVATTGDYNDLTNKPSSGSVSSVAGRTGDVTLTKSDVDLSNVDNTTDTNKPVSTLQQTAISNASTADRSRSNHTGTQASTTITGLATVATSGSYDDLSDQPTIPIAVEGEQGPPGLIWRGTWDTNASYALDDTIQYSGRAFIAIQASTGITPPTSATSTSYWALLVDRGATGPAGTGAAGVVSPADLSFKAWAGDPALLAPGTRTTLVAGQMNGVLLNLPSDTITGVSYFVGVIGANLVNCYIGVIDAITGSRLAVTADISSTLTSTGFKRTAFTTPVAVSGGPVYVVFLANVTTGTTLPQVTKLPNTDTAFVNARGPSQSTGRIRVGQITTSSGLSSIPTSNDLSGNSAQNTGAWVALD
jgi:hypothetical protein